MPKSTQRKRSESSEAKTPLLLLDVIDNCLKDMARTFPQKELTPEEVEHWHKDLSVFPQGAIEWAFDNWRKNGRFFPVYGDILEQCIAWAPSDTTVRSTARCDAICRARHGKGYGDSDVKKLRELYQRKLDSTPELKENKRRMTDVEIEELLVALDKFRGSVPEFRKGVA